MTFDGERLREFEMTLELVSVGIDSYASDDYANLRNAAKDATTIATYFGRLLPEELRFHTRLLTSPEETTFYKVHSALKAAAESLVDDDSVFIFYFAGHAFQDLDGKQWLLCHDAVENKEGVSGALAPGQIHELKRIGKGKMFFCFDACRCDPLIARGSGFVDVSEFRDATWKSSSGASSSQGYAKSWTLFSCSDGQRASDRGWFVDALIDTINSRVYGGQETALGDSFRDNIEIFLKNTIKRENLRLEQTPSASGVPFTLIPALRTRPSVGFQPNESRPKVDAAPASAFSVKSDILISRPVASPSTPQASFARKAGERMSLRIKGVEYAFRRIPAGSFMMGSSKKEFDLATLDLESRGVKWADGYCETLHKVNISRGFWMLESPITQEMWETVMGKNPSHFKGFFKNTKRFPVEQISWNDCQEYIRKLNKMGLNPEGFVFSLPTEAEWEYACRAGTASAYYFGDSLNGEQANCDGSHPFEVNPAVAPKKGPCLGKTTEVGKYGANAWGLVDMHGNVQEWVQDWYGDYPTGEVTDPTGPEGGSDRVNRGGSWDDEAVECRAAVRYWDDPDYCLLVGARLALRPLG